MNIEKYVVRGEDGAISAFKPGFERIDSNEFAHYIGYGLRAKEVRAFGEAHRNGTPKQKKWCEDVLEDINFHPECATLVNGGYVQLERLIQYCERRGW